MHSVCMNLRMKKQEVQYLLGIHACASVVRKYTHIHTDTMHML